MITVVESVNKIDASFRSVPCCLRGANLIRSSTRTLRTCCMICTVGGGMNEAHTNQSTGTYIQLTVPVTSLSGHGTRTVL
jgi:hypothetical protein